MKNYLLIVIGMTTILIGVCEYCINRHATFSSYFFVSIAMLCGIADKKSKVTIDTKNWVFKISPYQDKDDKPDSHSK